MKTLQFWFGYGSTYSYLTIARISDLAASRGVSVDWQPLPLQPIFAALGWDQGPFIPNPNKLTYMWRDLERRAEKHDLPYVRPSVYPPRSKTTLRVGMVAAREGWCKAFTERVFRLHWAEGRYIGTEDNLNTAIRSLGRDAAEVLSHASKADIDGALALQSERARTLKIFGAPSFVVGTELFWGDDRLEEAIEWADAH